MQFYRMGGMYKPQRPLIPAAYSSEPEQSPPSVVYNDYYAIIRADSLLSLMP